MIILLVTFLTIALIITFIGLLRSSWFREPDQPEMSYALRPGRGGRVRRVYNNRMDSSRQIRVWRSSSEFKRRSGTGLLALMDVRSIFTSRPGEQTPWLGIGLILLTLCLAGVLLLRNVFPSSTLIVESSWPDVAVSTPVPKSASSPPAFSGVIGVSKVLDRVSQLDPQQYNSAQEYDKWAYSACSAAAMTEVINAYNKYYRMGRQYRIADILSVEIALGEITPELGLLRSTGIDRTVAKFNFQTKWLNKVSLEQLLLVANSGRPVIIGFPPERWNGGHLLVLRGGDRSSVYLADSSQLNIQKMSHTDFLKYWAGFAVIVTPQGK